MATTYKVLGQSAPGATTDTTLYTVPAATESVVSTIVVANRGSGSSSYRIAVMPAGATLANRHYIAYDVLVSGNDAVTITIGITLSATDVISVRSSSANLSFSAFGSEISE